jgi:hypothetical protein
MTGRERLNAIMHRQPTDRLCWSTLVDDATLNALPGEMRGMSGLEFYRHLGCDVLSLNNWGLPYDFRSPELQWGESVESAWSAEGECATAEYRTPAGTLRTVTRRAHPVKYLVETLDDLRVYRSMWEQARFAAVDDSEVFARTDAAIGDDGIITRFWGPSTIPRLLENDFGTTNFYYLLHDHPADMEALIALIHERELEAFRILAEGPCEVVTLCENTSTMYISPEVYRRYNGPHVRDFVDIMHAAGTIALIHMCGHVRNLLDQIRGTGLDGVHALTPPPTGDTPWELALDVLGENTIIAGAFDPSIFVLNPVEDIGPALDRLYTPRLRRAPFVLLPGADGIVVPLERFEAVARWMEGQ